MHGHLASSFLPVLSSYSDVKLKSARIFKGEIVWVLAFVLDTKNSNYYYDTILCPEHIIFVDSKHEVLFFFTPRYFLQRLHVVWY